MLATPLMPTHSIFTTSHAAEDPNIQARPARDRETFLSLLPPPVEFIEGSSTGALAVPPGKYKPINASPKAPKEEIPRSPKLSNSTPLKAAITPKVERQTPCIKGIDLTWPGGCTRGTGFYNVGNTCFLNSALQCLLHTPPLIRKLFAHKANECRLNGSFCMLCAMRQVMITAYRSKNGPTTPDLIIGKMHVIAKNMRKGRQEDSHEFLRFAIDAMQKACLAGQGPKPDPKIAEATWVHGIFGGRLRSRVQCTDCGYNSDTFDRILDLSVDIHNAESLKDTLKKFVAVDVLRGADKYKCEKCKKPVIAKKRFTIHEAPPVLTVHFKRFSPLGRKIGHPVTYDEHLSLAPYMSRAQDGPTYDLYGVVCHAGGGPHSGHYYAMVKDSRGKWWEMNDEAVSPLSHPPLGRKNAYVLFYIKRKGEGLEAAINTTTVGTGHGPGLISKMKKRKEREMDQENGDDVGTVVSPKFIEPLLPSPLPKDDKPDAKRAKLNRDPQAAKIKKKIDALNSLNAYDSDSDADSGGGPSSPVKPPATSSPAPTPSAEDKEPESPSSASQKDSRPTFSPLNTSSPKPEKDGIPASNFYGSTPRKKRDQFDSSGARSGGYASALNPYNRFSKKRQNRPRAI